MDRAAGQHWMIVEDLQMVLRYEKEEVVVVSDIKDRPFEMNVVVEELPSQGPCSPVPFHPHPAPRGPEFED